MHVSEVGASLDEQGLAEKRGVVAMARNGDVRQADEVNDIEAAIEKVSANIHFEERWPLQLELIGDLIPMPGSPLH